MFSIAEFSLEEISPNSSIREPSRLMTKVIRIGIGSSKDLQEK